MVKLKYYHNCINPVDVELKNETFLQCSKQPKLYVLLQQLIFKVAKFEFYRSKS